jgi:hypothetical protein
MIAIDHDGAAHQLAGLCVDVISTHVAILIESRLTRTCATLGLA